MSPEAHSLEFELEDLGERDQIEQRHYGGPATYLVVETDWPLRRLQDALTVVYECGGELQHLGALLKASGNVGMGSVSGLRKTAIEIRAAASHALTFAAKALEKAGHVEELAEMYGGRQRSQEAELADAARENKQRFEAARARRQLTDASPPRSKRKPKRK